MKFLMNKKKMTATTIIVTLVASIALFAIANAQTVFYPVIGGVDLRQVGLMENQMPAGILYGWGTRLPAGVTPDIRMPTRAYMSFTPNPIGVGQTLLVNVFYTPSSQRVYKTTNYTITITKPDSQKVVFDTRSWTSERTSYIQYVPDMVGTYTLEFSVPENYWPRGTYYDYTQGGCYNMTASILGLASTTGPQTLTVQAEQVFSWPPAPLPTDYWTRPVAKELREWWPILGAYPGTGYVGGQSNWATLYPGCNVAWSERYNFHPWVPAPNTAHILRKEVQSIGGVIGGQANQYPASGSVTQPSVAYAGYAYETKDVLVNGVPTSCAVCYKIRTGEIKYARPISQGGFTPTIVSYLDPAAIDTPYYGTSATWSVELISITGGRLIKVDPNTGAISGNYSISPLTTGTYYRNGDGTGVGPFVLTVQNIGNTTNPNYRLIKWTTRGTATDVRNRVIENTTYAKSSLPTVIDWSAGLGADITIPQVQSTYLGIIIQTYNLWTGILLRNVSDTDIPYVPSNYVADHGRVAAYMKQDAQGTTGGYYKAWDMTTGAVAWTGDSTPYPWGQVGFAAYSVSSGYGKILLSTYAGVAAWDWETGKLAWLYVDKGIPYEAPYITNTTNINPFFNRVDIVDGKAFAVTIEHGETSPYYRGWGLRAINITTGELIWKFNAITGGTGFNSNPYGIVEDGYLIGSSGQDGTEYVFGKGKSATAVDAPNVEISLGTSALITGSVMDMSPAQPNTPCVAPESMTLQMEYIHLQEPIGGIYQNESLVGVPVSLSAIGSDGTFIDLGTVTSNGYYGTFSKAWEAPKEDTYTITATFAGSDAYSISSAATAITVGPAPPETPGTGGNVTSPDNTNLLYGILAAVVIAILIGLAALVLTLRKR